MALQRFTVVFFAAVIVANINTAGVNSVELNSTNFASTPKVTIKRDSIQTETESTTSLASKVLAESSATMPLAGDAIAAVGDTVSPANLTEARITSITFRSEESDVDKENDETISFGIRSFTVEIATPPTEKPIPLNERVGAANKINVQQAAASSLPILTLESDQDRNDKVSNERPKVFAPPLPSRKSVPPVADVLSPKSTILAKSKQEIMASSDASAMDMNIQSPASVSKIDSTNTFAASHTASTAKSTHKTAQPTRSNGNNEHEQLSISSNGMHVEQKLENGLYRIKIAEIITDEFSNGQHDVDTKQMLDDSISNSQKFDKDVNSMHGSPINSQPSGHCNIADLYPSKLEDFSSIIRESNEKLIEEKNRFVGLEKSANNDQSAVPNSRFNIIDDGNEQENSIQFNSDAETALDLDKQRIKKANGVLNSIENNIPTTKIEIELIDGPGASKDDVKIIGPGDDDDYVSPVERANAPNNDKVTDFTSELQLKDDMVSKIEQSFRESSMTNIQPKQQNQQQQQQPITINHPINPMGFIERRVKKFDPSLKKRMLQNAENTNRDSVAMANTKSIDENIISQTDEERKFDAHIPNAKPYQRDDSKHTDPVNPNKFVLNKQTNSNANSSRSQLVDKNNKVDGGSTLEHQVHGINSAKKDLILSTLEPINATERNILFINVNGNNGNSTIDKKEMERMQKHREQIIKESQSNANVNAFQTNRTNDSAAISTNMHLHIIHDDTVGQKPSESIRTNYVNADKQSPVASKSNMMVSTTKASTTLLEAHPTESVVTLNRTTSKEPSATPALIDAISSTKSNLVKHSSSQNSIKSITQSPVSTTVSPTTTTPTPTTTTAAPTTMEAKPSTINENLSRQQQNPFGRRGFDGFYFDTECDMQTPIPSDSTVWRGNETHELNLPTTTPENCSGGGDCMPMIISWEGTAEIQSGDVLIVEIDDTLLLPADMSPSAASIIDTFNGHRVVTAVYQVTRPGHEHCDATEGILLDITPLVVDGKKLVTLYDKDLTEGVNLLIVVSDLWGPQCVRLKVTVKSDNCGENAQCSGKGVCFSNASMEGYECQCCTGFAGSHCEEIDACSLSPCTNNGICVDLSQGHDGNSYQCLCPYGYTGKNCQFESDPCQNGECQNGGTCTGNATHFRCECAPGFTGPLCQHNLNECESSPCVHGICVDQEDGFRCFCKPGFSGELCNYEYNECDSNPCLNDGQCTDHIGGFSCKCTRGFTGKRCHIKVDFCANNPCPEGHQCMDHGNDFSCECPEGRSGLDCSQIPRTVIVCHCRFHKSYRRFTTRQHQLIPIFGFGRRAKQQLNNPRHWLSGKGHLSSSNKTASTTALNQPNSNGGAPATNTPNYHPTPLSQQVPRFQRHLAMNLENDMYYTVDFSDSQHSPLIH